MRISDWSSDVCSSDLRILGPEIIMSVAVDALDRIGIDIGAHRQGVACRDRQCASGAPSIQRIGTLAHIRVPVLAKGGIKPCAPGRGGQHVRSDEHTSELQSLMRNSYAVFCLKKKNKHHAIICTLNE